MLIQAKRRLGDVEVFWWVKAAAEFEILKLAIDLFCNPLSISMRVKAESRTERSNPIHFIDFELNLNLVHRLLVAAGLRRL